MNNLHLHKIQCPECKHWFVGNSCSSSAPIVNIPGLLGIPMTWGEVQRYECPKCHHIFSGKEIKRTRPASIWEIILSKL